MTTRTYRGRSIEELLPRVRAELGPDAIITRQREGLAGGVGGFFQKRMVEIEATAPDAGAGFSVRDDSPAVPDFMEHLSTAQRAAQSFEFEPDTYVDAPAEDDTWAAWSAAQPPPPAPAVSPVLSEHVPALPSPPAPAPGEVWGDAWGEAPPPAHAFAAPPEALPAVINRPESAAVGWPEEAAPLRDALVGHGLAASLAEEVVSDTVTHLVPLSTGAKLRKLVATELARRIPVSSVRNATGRVVAFVGAGGAGKTHCVGHLAAAYAQSSGQPVACVALRPRDGGSELALLLAPAGVPMRVATDGPSAAAHVAALRAHALVFVDTPAAQPRAKGDLRTLQSELRAIGADEVLLTLPATSSAAAAEDLITATRRLGVSGLALTHADETDHLGPAVGTAIATELPFAYVSKQANGSSLRPAAADELATALLGRSTGSSQRR